LFDEGRARVARPENCGFHDRSFPKDVELPPSGESFSRSLRKIGI